MIIPKYLGLGLGKKWQIHLGLFILLVMVLKSNADLYNASDPLIILNHENFYQTVLGNENAWLIEFYLSWCGHCINFVPIWRQFSYDILGWKHTIKVGVIDCSDDVNLPVCRNYGVKLYPHVRFLSSNATKDTMGSVLHSREVNELKEDIIDMLLLQEENSTSSPTWVNLIRYRDSFGKIFDSAPKEAKNAVIIIEDGDSLEGTFSIMDLGDYPEIYGRTMTASDAQDQGFNVISLPTILLMDRTGKQTPLTENVSGSGNITNSVLDYFGIMKKEYYSNTTLDGAQDPIEVTPPDDGVQIYMTDMENAISYALTHEVLLQQSLAGETLTALNQFLDILINYFPARTHLHDYLVKLHAVISKQRANLDISIYETYLGRLNTTNEWLPSMQPWIGCKGSSPKYRGYPCGLWVLFHTITVNAVLKAENDPLYDPIYPLAAIHGFVKHLFGCKHCSQHFQGMYALDAETFVKKPNDGIIWLWKAHNKVNERLKGDLTEDPIHSKKQFPTKGNCPECWQNDDTFEEEAILQYLKRIYSKDSISLKGIQLPPSPKGFASSANSIYPYMLITVIAGYISVSHI